MTAALSTGPPSEEFGFHDEDIAIARRYAEALVDAAQKEGPVDAMLDELERGRGRRPQAVPAVRRGAGLGAGAERPRRIASSSRSSTVAPRSLVLRFLRVLNRHGRLGLLAAIRREARSIWDRRNRRIPVRVRSAVPLDDGQLQALRDRLAGLIAGTPILSVSTDPGLIGGLVVQVGDHLYDASVKSRLAQLRHRLIEGKTHEIQSRRDQFSYPA